MTIRPITAVPKLPSDDDAWDLGVPRPTGKFTGRDSDPVRRWLDEEDAVRVSLSRGPTEAEIVEMLRESSRFDDERHAREIASGERDRYEDARMALYGQQEAAEVGLPYPSIFLD